MTGTYSGEFSSIPKQARLDMCSIDFSPLFYLNSYRVKELN